MCKLHRKTCLTRWKWLYRIGLDEDLRNKWCVTVINFLLEFQLRPRHILGVQQSERLRTATRAETLINESIVYKTMSSISKKNCFAD